MHCRFTDEENANASLIVMTLALIFMRGGELVEDELWEALKQVYYTSTKFFILIL